MHPRSSVAHISFFSLLIICIFLMSATAQESPAVSDKITTSPTITNDTGHDDSKSFIRNSVLLGTVPVVFFFGVKAWDWSGDHSFYSRNEGWFGKGTDYAGADKAGHFFAHYMLQRSMYDLFNWTENGGSRKWVYSLGTSLTVGLLIELGDGFSSKYGFSFQDLTMDYLGIFLGAAFERFPVVDGFLGFSTTYSPTKAYTSKFNRRNIPKTMLEFVNDYSGWRTMIDFKLAGFERVGVKLPLALRVLQLDIGFCSRGYANYDKGKYERPKSRNLIFGLSLNSAQLMDESFTSESRGSLYGAAHRALEYYHVPVEKSRYKDF